MSAVQAVTNDKVLFDGTEQDHFDGKRYSKACGFAVNLAVSEQDGGRIVQLWQVNSRGNLSRCYLTVPVDKIDDVITLLQRMRDEEPHFTADTRVGLLVPVEELLHADEWFGESLGEIEDNTLQAIQQDTGCSLELTVATARSLWQQGFLEVI